MLASYPKSGNTWLRALIASALSLSFASFEDLSACVPELEFLRQVSSYKLPSGGRIIKTHESWCSKYRSAIYLVRDVRSVAVSYFFHLKRVSQFNGNFDKFIDLFVNGKLDGYGDWSAHVNSWCESPLGACDQLLVVRYEDFLCAPIDNLAMIMHFLGIYVDHKVLERSVKNNSLQGMRKIERHSHIDHHDGLDFVRNTNTNSWSDFIDNGHEELLKYKMGREMIKFGYL